MQSYPLLFDPIFKERLWGGARLRELLSKDIPSGYIGESWEISGVEGDISKVSNGPYNGLLLTELIERFGLDLLGESVVDRFGKTFPILIKYLDARLDLSIQVHPSDELAQERHRSFGKNEMWYVLEADESSRLIVGFNEDCDKQTYINYLKQNRLTELLAYHPVKPSDAFLIETGTIHAIGAGVVLAEIQQTSDVTYRLYDFDREDAHGNKRALHTELALEALDFKSRPSYRLERKALQAHSIEAYALANTAFFVVNELTLSGNELIDLQSIDSFVIYMVMDGNAVIYDADAPEWNVELNQGSTVLLPACCKKIAIDTISCRLLEVFV